MKISELIKSLKAILAKEGDLEVIGAAATVVHHTLEAPSPRVIAGNPPYDKSQPNRVILDFPTKQRFG